MIQLNNISKLYTSGHIIHIALSHIMLQIREGEFVAIQGPAGAGKSTLLHILGLLDSPTSGEYLFLGLDRAHYPEKMRIETRIGAISNVFQHFNLIDELNVYENVELPLLYMKVKGAERRRRVEQVLEEMKIVHLRKQFPPKLSGGQQQKAAIARAMITKPRLLLADEPTGNLDVVSGQEVMEQLVKLNAEGTTIVTATDSMHIANFAHRIIHLCDGRVVPENLKERFKV